MLRSGFFQNFTTVDAAIESRLIIPAGFNPYMQCVLLSDEFDFSTTHDVAFGGNWAGLSGWKMGGQITYRFLLTNIAATTFSTGPTFSLGSNSPNFNNMLTSAVQPSAATLNLYLANGAGGTYPGGGLSTTLATVKLPDLATPPTIHITAGATGTAITQAKAKISIEFALTPVSVIPSN